MSLKLKNLHVLVVEDIQPMRELASAVLKAQGIGSVSYAADGRAGYDSYCKLRPDIIVTDWSMPNMDGLELVRLIRTSPGSPDKTVPIIMMTGYGSPLKISSARDLGVTEFLVKPFSAIDISKRIINIIRSPRDFIITENYAGPDRRRKTDTGLYPTGSDVRSNPKGYKEIIKANHLLQAKVGLGLIPQDKIEKSQSVIEKNRFDFKPTALTFLHQLRFELDEAQKSSYSSRRSIEKLINPIMQIKANARIFKYSRLGDMASIMLNFLEGMNELDKDILDIIESNYKSLRHIVQEGLVGDAGSLGQTFENELEAVCKRYTQSRITRQKEALSKIVAT
jgi:two-component system, chemotaxis family, chemotaxis protein CheY